MYDFLVSNNMLLADFMSKQSVTYTYSCPKTNVFTWIDHFAVFSHEISDIVNCSIVPPDAANTSDHIPVSQVVNVTTSTFGTSALRTNHTEFSVPNWHCRQRNNLYKLSLESKLQSIPLLSFTDPGQGDVNTSVNSYISIINAVIHDCARDAGVT